MLATYTQDLAARGEVVAAEGADERRVDVDVAERLDLGELEAKVRADLGLDEVDPGLVGLVDDLVGVGRALALLAEGELVRRLAVGDLVRPEPLSDQRNRSW